MKRNVFSPSQRNRKEKNVICYNIVTIVFHSQVYWIFISVDMDHCQNGFLMVCLASSSSLFSFFLPIIERSPSTLLSVF